MTNAWTLALFVIDVLLNPGTSRFETPIPFAATHAVRHSVYVAVVHRGRFVLHNPRRDQGGSFLRPHYVMMFLAAAFLGVFKGLASCHVFGVFSCARLVCPRVPRVLVCTLEVPFATFTASVRHAAHGTTPIFSSACTELVLRFDTAVPATRAVAHVPYMHRPHRAVVVVLDAHKSGNSQQPPPAEPLT